MVQCWDEAAQETRYANGLSDLGTATAGFGLFIEGMSKIPDYTLWAQSFIRARRVVKVHLDDERGEYEAISENGSRYPLERLEQARALLQALRETHSA